MISICIPIYNFNVSTLVMALEEQIAQYPLKTQIVLIDDASTKEFKDLNEAVCSKHVYLKLEKNIGRSAIRNLFLEHAQYENMLFLDCDSLVEHPDFIANYLAAIEQNPNNVICGGRVYRAEAPDKAHYLRWKYGIKKESKSAAERAKNPNRSFMTNNFVVAKNVLKAIGFDERLKNYGHEDTLFGYELKENKIAIIHIENPVVNGHLETNAVYITNTEKAVENLVHILDFTSHDKEIIQDVTLLRTYKRFKLFKPLIRLCYTWFGPLIKKRLSKGNVSLRAFDCYKLGYLSTVWKHKDD
ncbi:MAG: glycosyltransferase family 2 protein [Gilvibacter sp.]